MDVFKLRSVTISTNCSGAGLQPQPMENLVNPLQGIADKTFLHSLPEQEVYKHLIDCYRMRIEDEYCWEGDVGGLYAGEDPTRDFTRFLAKAAKKQMLPPWWNAKAKKECLKLAHNMSDKHCIHHAVEKHDIQETWNDPMMPMKLRMLAETIHGRALGQ